jgi:hypothetical protein
MKDMHMHMMEGLNKNLSQNRLIIIINYIIMDIEPIPKPIKTIKVKDIKYIKNLDTLFSDKWKSDYFTPKK